MSADTDMLPDQHLQSRVVDTVWLHAQASKIPPFFVAFCVTPFASNASELVSSLKFAAAKRRKNISLTFSQVCSQNKRVVAVHASRCTSPAPRTSLAL